MTRGDAPVVLLASGTRGDVHPFLALAMGLKEAGIPAVVAATPRFQALVESRGVGFAALDGNPSDLMASGSRSMAASLRGGATMGFVSTARFLRTAQPEYRRMLESATAVCRRVSAVLVGLASLWGLSIAEARGVPSVLCMLQPFGRTRAFPSALVPLRLSLGGWYNALSHRVVEQVMWLPWQRTINQWRSQTLGLRTLPRAGPWRTMYASGFSCLYGFSPAVLPAPTDWPSNHIVTGYWFLPGMPRWEPKPALERFLSSGERPLYIGFGSMGLEGGRNAFRVIERALRLSGRRAVISLNSRLPPGDGTRSMFFENDVPHEWLFPRVAAVMHHGGAGTTAEGVRAGIPSIIFPTGVDQHFWAERIARLGAGTRPVGRREMTPSALAELFTLVTTDRQMQERARLLGARVSSEDGVSRAVAALLPLLSRA